MKRALIPIEQLSDENKKLFDVLNDGSELACVVVGLAFLDASLASLLGHRLIPSSVTARLLSAGAVLGSFSARADLAYALSLIKKLDYQDLSLLGQIRNEFAHSHLELSFENALVRERCAQLQTWRTIGFSEEESPAPELGPRIARNQFTISVALLSQRLLVNALSARMQQAPAGA